MKLFLTSANQQAKAAEPEQDHRARFGNDIDGRIVDEQSQTAWKIVWIAAKGFVGND